MRKIIVAGNWKMNKDKQETQLFTESLALKLRDQYLGNCEVVIAPPFPFLAQAQQNITHAPIQISAQNVSEHESGAYTGEVSAPMLQSLEIGYCIVGHSERRAYYGETDFLIRQKAEMLRRFGIKPIICIGETLAEREAGETEQVILSQLTGCFENVKLDTKPEVVIAYEPVWAIGTGRTATPEQAQEVHASIRNWLANQYNSTIAQNTTILYGGSAKPENFAELLAQSDIDGGLIGGASLDLDAFINMIHIAIDIKK